MRNLVKRRMAIRRRRELRGTSFFSFVIASPVRSFSSSILATLALYIGITIRRGRKTPALACTDNDERRMEREERRWLLPNIYTFLPLALPRGWGMVDGYYIYRCTFWNFTLLPAFQPRWIWWWACNAMRIMAYNGSIRQLAVRFPFDVFIFFSEKWTTFLQAPLRRRLRQS